MAYKSVVSDTYIKVQEIGGDEDSTTLNYDGVRASAFKSGFDLSPGILDLERDESCLIRLSNIDEGDRMWEIRGPNLSGELIFTYSST